MDWFNIDSPRHDFRRSEPGATTLFPSKDRLEFYFIRVELHLKPESSGPVTDCANREVLPKQLGANIFGYFMTTSVPMAGFVSAPPVCYHAGHEQA